MLLTRLLIAIPFIPILVLIFLKGNISFLLFVEVISVISLYEFYKMVEKKELSVYLGLFLGSLIPILTYFRFSIQDLLYFIGISNSTGAQFEIGTFIVFSLFVLVIKQIIFKEIDNSLIPLTLTLFGIIYIPYLMSHLILLRSLPSGTSLVIYSFFSIWACDTGAYFFGILFGKKIFKKSLAKEISPKKSIEGSIGGIISVYILTLFFDSIMKFFNSILISLNLTKIIYSSEIFNISNIKIIILTFLIFIFATMGDLAESKFKREFKIKDSGNLLLGHGGFLDRFDSALFVVPLVYYFSKFFILI